MAEDKNIDDAEKNIGGSVYFKVAFWILWKKVQILVRSHLSHLLAISLGLLVLVREWRELKRMAETWHFGWEEALILVITLGTIVAALWELELFGSKLSTSPQEVRFVRTMRSLLQTLESFTYGKDKDPALHNRLDSFVKTFLEMTSFTLCGKKELHAALMMPSEDKKEVQLSSKTDGAMYPDKLSIPLPDASGDRETGPAGYAYQLLRIVYMPLKKWRLGWAFRYEKRTYEPSELKKGWIDADDKTYEDFRSVLCVPVAIYQKQNKKQPFGVLNYSTKSFDPFIHRDFMMAECFSSILAMAFAAIQREAAEKEQEALRAASEPDQAEPKEDTTRKKQ